MVLGAIIREYIGTSIIETVAAFPAKHRAGDVPTLGIPFWGSPFWGVYCGELPYE